MEYIDGGVVAPKGFKAYGIHCGIRKNRSKEDLAVIISDKVGTGAAVYTKNKVKGAPITVTKENLKDGKAQAVICNSGNANTCNANGVEIATKMCHIMEDNFGVEANNVIVGSTGVIGQPLDIAPIESGIDKLKDKVTSEKIGSELASKAIMTTDMINKEVAVEFDIDGVKCTIGVISKGSGMIHPNMATMLGFVTTDINITAELLHKALLDSVEDTYNMLSVDGDTSTNDMVSILANGMSGNKLIDTEDDNYKIFANALKEINEKIVMMMAKDGEGASKLLLVNVEGSQSEKSAKIIAKSVCTSSLVKTAIFGMDANWGRILCAIGYADAPCDVDKVRVTISSDKGEVLVCDNGAGVSFSEEKALEILKEDEISINITLGDGDGVARAYGCDLTFDYVKINAEYRT